MCMFTYVQYRYIYIYIYIYISLLDVILIVRVHDKAEEVPVLEAPVLHEVRPDEVIACAQGDSHARLDSLLQVLKVECAAVHVAADERVRGILGG